MNDEAISNLGFLLCDTARMLKSRFDSRAKKLGLTRSQWQVLAMVKRFQGMHQAALAELLEIEPITLTRLLERMEKGGWVVRKADENDKRVRCVFLSAKATPMLAQLKATGQELVDEMMEGTAAGAREQLMQTLAKMNVNLADMGWPRGGIRKKKAA